MKSLCEPEDLFRTIARDRWKERRNAKPDRYNFRAVLRHSERGTVSEAAANRLRTIIDQFPDIKTGRVEEILDGGVSILLERAEKSAAGATGVQGIIFTQMFEGKEKSGQLVIQSAIKQGYLEFDLPEFQSFFVKVLRTVVEATPRFFGASGGKETKDVLFLHWKPPDILVSAQMPTYAQEKIKQLFADFVLDLELIISVQAPEIPVSVLRAATATG